MLAGTCGMIAGLVDMLFVGYPGEGRIGKKVDESVDNAVIFTAKMFGWKVEKEGSIQKKVLLHF